MNDLPSLESLRNASLKYVGEIDVPAWQALAGSAMWRRHSGDVDGAIDEMVRAIGLTKMEEKLAEKTASYLNYLADLYLLNNAPAQAEETLQESIELSRPRFPKLLADDLWILAGIQMRKGEHRDALASAEEARQLYHQQHHAHGVAEAEKLIEEINLNLPMR